LQGSRSQISSSWAELLFLLIALFFFFLPSLGNPQTKKPSIHWQQLPRLFSAQMCINNTISSSPLGLQPTPINNFSSSSSSSSFFFFCSFLAH
jgi:hypothetical protein